MEITVGIPTKNRYDVLSHCLLSLAFQTKKPYEVIIVDDTDKPVDIRTLPIFNYVLRLFDDYNIKWQVVFGQKKGQHYSHQLVQEIATTDWIFRIDDDGIAEPDVLEELTISARKMMDKFGAVAPLVLMPGYSELPSGLTNDITKMSQPNVQWYKWYGEQDADHLYSCFLYKKGIEKFELSLSKKAHREETIFTYGIKRKGFDLKVNASAVVWHWRQESGGIRSDNNVQDYENDERIFNGFMNLWEVNQDKRKVIVLDSGLGDHWAFKHILPELKQKHKKILIAACFPDVFYDEPGIDLISIAEAKLMFGNIDTFQIYRYMIDLGWKGNLVDAFKKLYLC